MDQTNRQGIGIEVETVFENGRAVEPLGAPDGPTLREQIAASDVQRRAEAAIGTAHFAQLDAKFREQQDTGRIEIEVVRPAIGPMVSLDLI